MALVDNVFGSGPGSIIPDVGLNVKALDNLSIVKRVYTQIQARAEDARRKKALIEQGLLNPDGTQKVTESMGKIREFISTINAVGGLAKQNWFSVDITSPTTHGTEKTVSLFCNSASIPSNNIVTSDLKIYGVVTQMPFMRAYEDVTMTFLVDKKMMVKTFFDKWCDLVVDDSASGTRDVGFLREYATNIQIYQLSSQDANQVHLTVLQDAYPKSVGALTLNYGTPDFHHLTVTFTYQKLINYAWDQTAPSVTTPLPQNLLDSFIKKNVVADFGNKLGNLVDKYSAQVGEWTTSIVNKASNYITNAFSPSNPAPADLAGTDYI